MMDDIVRLIDSMGDGIALFVSWRDYHRAENLRALCEAYHKPSSFMQIKESGFNKVVPPVSAISCIVCDELPMKKWYETICRGKKIPYIFIGHGIPGGKKYGLDQKQRYFKNPEWITWAITDCEETRELVARQLGISVNQVLPYGLPRTFRLMQRRYLWVPTWVRRKYEKVEPPDFKTIDNLLEWNETFVVKPHPKSISEPDETLKHFEWLDPQEPTTDVLLNCHCLITDFSSIAYDGVVAGKPVVIWGDGEKYCYDRWRDTFDKGVNDEQALIKNVREKTCHGFTKYT